MTFEVRPSHYAPGEKLYFRNGAGNDPSSKIQRLHGTITRLLEGTDDPDKKKTLEDMQSELDKIEEEFLKFNKANETELEERRKNQTDGEPNEDSPEEELKKNRDVDEAKMQAQRESDSQGRYSVLSYKVASKGVKGDSFMKLLGVCD